MKKSFKTTKTIPFLVAMLVCFCVFTLTSCRETPPSESIDIPTFEIFAGTDVIFNSHSPADVITSLKAGELTFKNSSETEITPTLIITTPTGKTTKELSLLQADEELKVEVEISTLDGIYFSYKNDQGTKTNCSFAFTENGVLHSLETNSDYLIIPKILKIDSLTVTRPLSVIIDNTTFSVKNLYFGTESEGDFIIEEKGAAEFDCDEFFADAVNCDVKIPKIKEIEQNTSYYLRVKTYNSKVVYYNSITVDSLQRFDSLIDDNKLPKLYPGTTLTLKEFTLDRELTLNFPISFIFDSSFTLKTPISVTTEEICVLGFAAIGSPKLPSIPVKVTAPNANVVWDIPRADGITMYDIANSMDAATLNGKKPEEYALGGDGTAKLTSVVLDKNANKNIVESIIWKQTDNVFTATIDCVVDINTLKNAFIELKASSGGKVTFDESVTTKDGKVNLLANSGCYVTVTDSKGKTNRYLIETNYVPSKIPVVVINTENGATVESNEEYIKGSCYMNCDAITGFDSVSERDIEIRGRGHSTWKWEKKPYKIKFETKTSLFGLESAKEWVLLANYTDKSLIRSFVAMEGARVLDNLTFVGVQYPVDLFLNGEYLGVYTLGEQIEAKKGRVELTDNGTAEDTGFLLEIGGTSSEDVWNETCFYTTLCKYVKVKSPNEQTLTKDQVAYIRDYVKKADEAVMTGVGYEDYIDIDSLIDWVIVHELYYNIDSCFRRSCYFTKEPGGKLKMGPIWDFDNAFGNFWKDDKTYSTWATADSTTGYIWDNWMSYLINYPEFRMKFKARWEEVKYPLLEKLLESIDKGAENIERSAEYNFIKWDILNKRVGCQDSSIVKYNTFEKQINYFKDFVNKRWKWLDDNI